MPGKGRHIPALARFRENPCLNPTAIDSAEKGWYNNVTIKNFFGGIMQSVLITGASGGMGRAAVESFLASGYRVFALDIKAGEYPDGVISLVGDVTDEASLLAALEETKKSTDSLDAILHFAGIYMLDSLVEMSDEAFSRILNINLRGAYLVNKTFLPLLRRGSRIVITTSELATLDPLPFTGIYAVTKAALDKYAFSLRMELQLLGISVSVLRSGAVKTDMIDASCVALDRFCSGTALYSCNAKRFKSIVDRVEARSVSPARLAKKCLKIIGKKRPRFAYSINRNPLLRLLNILPDGMQFAIIKRILR